MKESLLHVEDSRHLGRVSPASEGVDVELITVLERLEKLSQMWAGAKEETQRFISLDSKTQAEVRAEGLLTAGE